VLAVVLVAAALVLRIACVDSRRATPRTTRDYDVRASIAQGEGSQGSATGADGVPPAQLSVLLGAVYHVFEPTARPTASASRGSPSLRRRRARRVRQVIAAQLWERSRARPWPQRDLPAADLVGGR
jgi:hypothetical protein